MRVRTNISGKIVGRIAPDYHAGRWRDPAAGYRGIFECVDCGYTTPDADDPLRCAVCASNSAHSARHDTYTPEG